MLEDEALQQLKCSSVYCVRVFDSTTTSRMVVTTEEAKLKERSGICEQS